jgi:hypothetical protein
VAGFCAGGAAIVVASAAGGHDGRLQRRATYTWLCVFGLDGSGAFKKGELSAALVCSVATPCAISSGGAGFGSKGVGSGHGRALPSDPGANHATS